MRLGWDEEVSGLHAQIAVVARRGTLVDDGLSRNGSYVNEVRVHGRRHLRDGDAIRFGRTTVVYRRPGDSAPEATAIATDVPAAATVSPAQRKVLVALCRPYKDGGGFATPATNQQIGAELHLSVDAVKTHMRALFEKLGVGDLPQNQKRVALVERALQIGGCEEPRAVAASPGTGWVGPPLGSLGARARFRAKVSPGTKPTTQTQEEPR